MRISRRIGAAGVGVGVALGFSGVIGAAVAVPASSADAATSTTYNSTASAEAGVVTVGGAQVPVPDNSVSATDTSGPQNGSLGLSAVESELSSVPTIGPTLESALNSANPSGANLVTESATASSDGTSSACAGLLVGACSDGKPTPITIDLSLSKLFTLANLPVPNVPSASTNQPASTSSGNTGSGSDSGTGSGSGSSTGSGSSGIHSLQKGLQQLIPSQMPTGLTTSATRMSSSGQGADSSAAPSSDASSAGSPLDDQIVLTLSGPEAACTAGVPGSAASNFTATQSLASATLDLEDASGNSLIGGAKSVSGSDVLNQIPSSVLSTLTSQLGTSLPTGAIGITINPGSTSGAGSGPGTSATAGELGLSIAGTQILSVTGAKAVCGPNNAAEAAATKPATKTSSETPLGGGIETDEGYYAPPSSDDALWISLMAGGAALATGAGGFSFWRRRLHRS